MGTSERFLLVWYEKRHFSCRLFASLALLCDHRPMVLRRDFLCALISLAAVCGCSSPAPASLLSSTALAPSTSPIASSSPSSASPSPSIASPSPSPSASSSAPQAPQVAGFTTQTSAASTFSMQCVGPNPARHMSGPPRACILRGRIRAVKRVDTLHDASWLHNGFTPPVANQALDIDVAPDDSVPCSTPLDTTAKDIRLPEADYPDLSRHGRVRILGAERIAAELVVGKRVCGWSRFTAQPGMGYQTGWEGELMGADAKESAWKLLGAYSVYLSPSTNKYLSRVWGFIREGAARRIPVEEGGAFIIHDAVRVQHAGRSAVSKAAAEVLLKAPDGTFAVQAMSDLTVGNVPVFVGQHDGFFFAAVRTEP